MRGHLSRAIQKLKRSKYRKLSEFTVGEPHRLRPIRFKYEVSSERNGILVDTRLTRPFYVWFYVHWGFKSGEQNKSYMCLELIKGRGKCPFCQYAAAAADSQDKSDQKIADDIRQGVKLLMNAVDIRAKQAVILTIWQSSIFNRLDELVDNYGDLAHPKNGRPLILRVTTNPGRGKYSLDAADPAPTPAYQGAAMDLMEAAKQTEVVRIKKARRILKETFGSMGGLDW